MLLSESGIVETIDGEFGSVIYTITVKGVRLSRGTHKLGKNGRVNSEIIITIIKGGKLSD